MSMESGLTARSEINITPLIDVLLVLLIIFILLMNRAVLIAQLAHEEGAATRDEKIHSIVLELRDDGSYTINTQQVPREQLVARLREIFAPRQDKLLFIKSGGQRTYGEAVSMIDLAKGAGVEVVALAP